MKLAKLIKENFELIHAKYISNYLIAQLGLLFLSPFISRIYNPSEIAIASVFYTFTAIAGVTSTLSLENSILIEQEKKDVMNGFFLSITLCFIFSLLISLLPYEFLLNNFISDYDFDKTSFNYLIPFAVFLLGSYNSLRLLVIKNSKFNILGISKIIIGILIPLLSISLGLNGLSYKGIIFSYLIGLLIVNLFISVTLFTKNKIQFNKFDLKIFCRLFFIHSKLIKWTMPSNLVSSLTSSLPVFFIGYFYGSELLGKYELAYRAIYFPLGIIISSFQDIFKEKITKEITKLGNCINVFNSFLNIQIRIAIFFLIPILIIFPYFFQLFFGQQWSEGGYLIQMMFLLISINFVATPLSITLVVCNRQKVDFIWQVVFCITTTLSFMISNYIFNFNINLCLFVYSFMAFCLYLIEIYLSKLASNYKIPRVYNNQN